MVRCVDEIHSYSGLCQLFRAKYADEIISLSTVCRIVYAFEETGNLWKWPAYIRKVTQSRKCRSLKVFNPSNFKILLNRRNWRLMGNVIHEFLQDDPTEEYRLISDLMWRISWVKIFQIKDKSKRTHSMAHQIN